MSLSRLRTGALTLSMTGFIVGSAGAQEAEVPPPPPLPPAEGEETESTDSEAPEEELSAEETSGEAEEGAGDASGSTAAASSGAAAGAAASDETKESSFRVHGTAGLSKAVAGYQSSEYGWGAGALAALEWGPSPLWGVQFETGFLGLGGTSEAPPSGLAELEGTTSLQLGLGLRVRPLAKSQVSNPNGLWFSAAVGAAFTGGEAGPLLDAFVGYDFPVSENLLLGPTLGYLTVLQTQKDIPRDDNAHLLLLGAHVTFDFGPSQPKVVDRDHDGILDEVDECPDEPEDKDGFEDEDGCPELDNDGDSIPDLEDRCPLDPEDLDEFEDEDGCPDLDNDGDQVLDTADECPLEPEDIDEFEDEDGCPDPDNDQDGIPDIKDLCPEEPETKNGIADNDGCPDEQSVRVVGDKIELDQKIHFWTNSDRIRGMSYPVLTKLAQFLVDHPEYVKVDVEGHADARGKEKFNLDLSKRRAASIAAFLSKKGVDAGRLSSDGFGSSRPLVEGKNEHAWFMNRRVEFIVTRNREVKVDPSSEKDPAFGKDRTEGDNQ